MYLLFDIGGTKMRIAYSSDGKTFEEPLIIAPTPQDPYDGFKQFLEGAAKVSKGRMIKAIAGGLPGPLNTEKTALAASPHLQKWVGFPFQKELERSFEGALVFLQNDAALVALGEATVGVGKGYRIVAYMTISTGVGGARIVDGKIDANAMGFEIGHQVIVSKEPHYLEMLISGSSLEKRYGKKPSEIDDPLVFAEIAEYLAYGINNTIVHWSPQIVILGGYLAHMIPLKVLRTHLDAVLKIFPQKPKIEISTLGDFGGIHGALAFVSQKINSHE